MDESVERYYPTWRKVGQKYYEHKRKNKAAFDDEGVFDVPEQLQVTKRGAIRMKCASSQEMYNEAFDENRFLIVCNHITSLVFQMAAPLGS